MKTINILSKLLIVFIIFTFFFTGLFVVFSNNCYPCSNQGMLIIDLAESEFLGKEIGEYYQCVEWLDVKKVKVYNYNNPERYLIYDISDKRFKFRIVENMTAKN